ncbi:MAG: polysaccharide biosynthesis C-terminal domain-containing protein [Oscillospiraceae bacterium]|nr:polysaccharide biosynthesis C-terminal domain-containing protein [Oscillospiraceae bacterium]
MNNLCHVGARRRLSPILQGTLLLTGANLLLRLISLVFQAFLERQLGAAGLGLLQLISTVGLMAGIIGASGVRVAAMFLTAEEFGHRRPEGVRQAVTVCLRYGLLLSCLAGAALFLGAEAMAQRWLQDARVALSLRVMGLLLPFSCLSGIMSGYYTACARIGRLIAVEIVERLLSTLLTVALLLTWARDDLGRACCAVVLGSSLGAAMDFALLYAGYRRDQRPHLQTAESSHMWGRLLRLCVPLALNDYLRAGLNTVEQFLIPYGLMRYGAAREAALADYGAIHGMVFPVLMFPAAILYALSDLLVPELSRRRATGDRRRIEGLTERCLGLCAGFAAAVAGLLFLNGVELGRLIYDSAAAGSYLRLFAPMVLILYLDAIVDGMLKGLAEQVRCVRYNTLTSVLDVLFLFLLLPRWGIGGYVFSFVVTHAINLYLSLRRLLQVTSYRLSLRALLRPVLCGLGAVLPLLLLPETPAGLAGVLLRSLLFLLFFGGFLLLGSGKTGTALTFQPVPDKMKEKRGDRHGATDAGPSLSAPVR